MSPAREFASEVLLAVERQGAYASELLHSARGRKLAPADRRLATELVLGVLRWRAQLDFVIGLAARRPPAAIAPPALAALRLGAYQLRFLSRIPASAAVHESVELAKRESARLGGFVNAVLRHLPREPVAALLAAEPGLGRRREIEFSHPAWLLERWNRHFTPPVADSIAEYNNQPPPVAIRLSPPAGTPGPDGAAAWPAEIATAPGRLLTAALRVTSGDVTKTALYRQRGIWIQDEASQLIPYLLEPWDGGRILDVCAAPGAKASLLHGLAPARTSLIALELHPHRARLLRRLVPEPAVQVVVADAARPLPLSGSFDRILVDAPCTGTGTLARNPEIRWRLQPGDPARLGVLQTAILRQALAALLPGGRCVYSVCSLEPEEGEAVVAAALQAVPGLRLRPAAEVVADLGAAGQLACDADPGALTHGEFLRILPGAWASDGFFAAILERD
ncbi:MAG: transcription antitermination factor NusB [Terriglobales bacterium]